HLGIDVTIDLPPIRVARHEKLTDGVLTGIGQLETLLGRNLRKEFVGHLNQDAGAIAGARIGADRATMLEVAEDREGVVDDLVRLAALDVGDETDAARILIERRVIKTLQLGPVAVSFGRQLALLSCPYIPSGLP